MPDSLLACNILHAAVHPEVRGLDVVSQARQTQVHNYLAAGNQKASKVIAGGGVQGYLYLLHEAVELDELAKWTPPPAPPARPGLIKRNGTQVSSAAAGASSTPKPPQSIIAKADAIARGFEIRAERFFARLALGTSVSLDALVASTTTLPTIAPTAQELAAAAVNDPLVRANVATILNCGTSAPAGDVAAATTVRRRLYSMNVAALRALGPVDRLAYALWETRGCRDLDDWFDWFEAEKALNAL